MKTDHLDLWQVHDVREEEELAEIFGPGGAIEAFVEAKAQGKTRFIGVTGHHDPRIIRQCIERFHFDTVLMPVNPAEPHHASFLPGVLPLAREKNMGIIGMKVYFRGFAAKLPGYTGMGPLPALRPLPAGHDHRRRLRRPAQLEENVRFARDFTPMSAEEQQRLVREVAPFARRLMYYKP